jgi:hypothetical protein
MALSTWIGPWGHKLPDGTDLIPGETQVEVSDQQATDDPYWEVVKPAKTTTTGKGGDNS